MPKKDQCKNGHPNPERTSRGTCKQCIKESGYHEKWYRENKERLLARMKERREEQQQRAFVLLGEKCVDCGELDFRTFEFDHLENTLTDTNISWLLDKKWERIEEELKKCELVCGSCHNIRTYERRNKGQWQRETPGLHQTKKRNKYVAKEVV
jgi:hypothetical protein